MLAGHRIDAVVGEGGMGVVYRATHLNLRRAVALKVLHPSLAADLDYRRRFEREAAIAASLEHPAVVPIYDAGHQNGVLYLSMRFVEGEDLGAVLQREGRLAVERLCALLDPVADALDAVHEAGLVHRDVKPGNVLIARPGRSRAGQVYLCDFGIAKGPADAGLTTAGQYVGTLQYSSPEQIKGQWIDGRSDQYGLACLAFRGLTGQVPYPREDSSAVIYAHLVADPPRPGRLRPDLPPAVDDVIARAAAKDPGHRFPSCAAFVAALRAAAAPRPDAGRPRPTLPIPAAPVPAPRPEPTPGTAAPARPSWPPTRPLPEPAAPAGAGAARPEPAPAGAARPDPDRPAAAARVTAPPATATPPAAASPAAASPAAKPTAAASPAAASPATASPAAASPATGAPAEAGGPVETGVPAPVGVRAERGRGDPSVAVSWTAGGPADVEYKVTRLAADGRWQVVGRTRSTGIIDGAVPAGAAIPVYGVVARSGTEVSAVTRSAEGPRPADPPPADPPPADPAPADPAPDDPAPGGFPPVRALTVAAPGTLTFDWPSGITEAMVVVRRDRAPAAPDDPAATSWKITNMRYQLDGGLLLPASVPRPCHVAVASCRRERGVLVVAPGFGPTARASVGG